MTSLYPRRSVAAGLRSLPPPQGASREGGPGVTLRKRKVLVHGAVVGAVRATLGAQVELRALVFDVRLGPVTTSIGSVQTRHARRRRAQLCLRVRVVPDGAEAA